MDKRIKKKIGDKCCKNMLILNMRMSKSEEKEFGIILILIFNMILIYKYIRKIKCK